MLIRFICLFVILLSVGCSLPKDHGAKLKENDAVFLLVMKEFLVRPELKGVKEIVLNGGTKLLLTKLNAEYHGIHFRNLKGQMGELAALLEYEIILGDQIPENSFVYEKMNINAKDVDSICYIYFKKQRTAQ